jgi:hypothetical protein
LDESGGGTGIDFNLNIENTDVNFDREDEAALNWPSNKICFFSQTCGMHWNCQEQKYYENQNH